MLFFVMQLSNDWLKLIRYVIYSCVNLLNLQDHCIKPIQAFQHPSFKAMIAVAARATHGVTIPSLKVTRAYIISLF